MPRTVGIIAAVSEDGVIARAGRIPWDAPADRRYFKRRTMGHAVIMGRRTWEALPIRPLPGRTNLVLTRSAREDVRTFPDLDAALAAAPGDAWIIGGAEVYRAGYAAATIIEITRVPVTVGGEGVVHMPPIPEDRFVLASRGPVPNDDRLLLETWTRRDA